MHHKWPPLPECPPGTNPFAWIVRTAPMVREARQAIAEQERRESDHAKSQEAQPAARPQAG